MLALLTLNLVVLGWSEALAEPVLTEESILRESSAQLVQLEDGEALRDSIQRLASSIAQDGMPRIQGQQAGKVAGQPLYFSYDLAYFPPTLGATGFWAPEAGKVNPALLSLSPDRAAMRAVMWDTWSLATAALILKDRSTATRAASRIRAMFLSPDAVSTNFTYARAIPLESPEEYVPSATAFLDMTDLPVLLDAAALTAASESAFATSEVVQLGLWLESYSTWLQGAGTGSTELAPVDRLRRSVQLAAVAKFLDKPALLDELCTAGSSDLAMFVSSDGTLLSVSPGAENRAAGMLDMLYTLGSLAAICDSSSMNLWLQQPAQALDASAPLLLLAAEAAAVALSRANMRLRSESEGGTAIARANEALPMFYRQYRAPSLAVLMTRLLGYNPDLVTSGRAVTASLRYVEADSPGSNWPFLASPLPCSKLKELDIPCPEDSSEGFSPFSGAGIAVTVVVSLVILASCVAGWWCVRRRLRESYLVARHYKTRRAAIPEKVEVENGPPQEDFDPNTRQKYFKDLTTGEQVLAAREMKRKLRAEQRQAHSAARNKVAVAKAKAARFSNSGQVEDAEEPPSPRWTAPYRKQAPGSLGRYSHHPGQGSAEPAHGATQARHGAAAGQPRGSHLKSAPAWMPERGGPSADTLSPRRHIFQATEVPGTPPAAVASQSSPTAAARSYASVTWDTPSPSARGAHGALRAPSSAGPCLGRPPRAGQQQPRTLRSSGGAGPWDSTHESVQARPCAAHFGGSPFATFSPRGSFSDIHNSPFLARASHELLQRSPRQEAGGASSQSPQAVPVSLAGPPRPVSPGPASWSLPHVQSGKEMSSFGIPTSPHIRSISSMSHSTYALGGSMLPPPLSPSQRAKLQTAPPALPNPFHLGRPGTAGGSIAGSSSFAGLVVAASVEDSCSQNVATSAPDAQAALEALGDSLSALQSAVTPRGGQKASSAGQPRACQLQDSSRSSGPLPDHSQPKHEGAAPQGSLEAGFAQSSRPRGFPMLSSEAEAPVQRAEGARRTSMFPSSPPLAPLPAVNQHAAPRGMVAPATGGLVSPLPLAAVDRQQGARLPGSARLPDTAPAAFAATPARSQGSVQPPGSPGGGDQSGPPRSRLSHAQPGSPARVASLAQGGAGSTRHAAQQRHGPPGSTHSSSSNASPLLLGGSPSRSSAPSPPDSGPVATGPVRGLGVSDSRVRDLMGSVTSAGGEVSSVTLAMDQHSVVLREVPAAGVTCTVGSIASDSGPSPDSSDALPVRDDTFFTRTLVPQRVQQQGAPKLQPAAHRARPQGGRAERGGGSASGSSLSLPLDGAESIQYTDHVLSEHHSHDDRAGRGRASRAYWKWNAAKGPRVRSRTRVWH